MKNKLVLKNVQELIEEKNFYIPSYQRGYRWTTKQVIDLLEDLFAFLEKDKKGSEFYCLQPIVVCETHLGGESQWELIDGQQRLTTIHIILNYFNKRFTDEFKKPLFELEYKTRTGSRDYLRTISPDLKDENIDYSFIYNTYYTVKDWFSDKQSIINDFESILLNRTYVIWYEINSDLEKPIDLFTRINIGKIPLTNAELVKALFLQKSNFKKSVDIKQLQIASEWDSIEKKLQNDSFWHFIYSSKNNAHYENRIEYIFDLMFDKKREHEEFFTFYKYSKLFSDNRMNNVNNFVDEEWQKIKTYFQRLIEWYNEHEQYHLVGFLIEYNFSISALIRESEKQDKDVFLQYVRAEIRNKFKGIDIDILDFRNNGDKEKIRMTLLLFNVLTILSTSKAIIKFPFDRYKIGKWDIEHVNSQTERQFDFTKRKDFAIDLLEYFAGQTIESLSKYLSNESDVSFQEFVANSNYEDDKKSLCLTLYSILESEKFSQDVFNDICSSLSHEFKEDKFDEGFENHISNLALLDQATNRSYGNAFFPIKRKRVIHNDRNGLFVPICTKNLFLKYYTHKIDEMMIWDNKDAADYFSGMCQTLKNFITIKSKENEQ